MLPLRTAIMAAALVVGPTTVWGQTLELTKVSCGDFIKSDQATIGNLMMWLAGYYMGNDDDPIIDFDKLSKEGKELGTYCAANPNEKLSDAAEKIMGKK